LKWDTSANAVRTGALRFVDAGTSRPIVRLIQSSTGLAKAIEYVRDSDTLVVHSLDRLARNVEDLLRTVRNLNARRSQPVDRPRFRDIINAAVLVWKRVVKGESGFPDLRWHDLRHEAPSRLFEKRLHPLEVASATGHRSMQMLKRYTHLNPADLLAKLG